MIGLEPLELEKRLFTHLIRAERWHAIVLIDEADIFLEKRELAQPLQKAACVAGKSSILTRHVGFADQLSVSSSLRVLYRYSYPYD